ncbi:unnamed protein product, partial [marine sediment metagenome]
ISIDATVAGQFFKRKSRWMNAKKHPCFFKATASERFGMMRTSVYLTDLRNII